MKIIPYLYMDPYGREDWELFISNFVIDEDKHQLFVKWSFCSCEKCRMLRKKLKERREF